MSGIKCFVAENSINAKIFHRFEPTLNGKRIQIDIALSTRIVKYLGKRVKHSSAYGCSVSPKKVFLRFFNFPIISITLTTISSRTVHFLHTFHIISRDSSCSSRIQWGKKLLPKLLHKIIVITRKKKSVMGITCRMLLWLKKCIKIPERTFNKIICRHFSESNINSRENELLQVLAQKSIQTNAIQRNLPHF